MWNNNIIIWYTIIQEKEEAIIIKYFNEKSAKKYLVDINKKPLFDEWFAVVKDILLNEEFQKRRLFKHHKKSVWDHCVDVSFKAFKFAKKHNLNDKVCAIGGLLHDFYPFAWQYSQELDAFDSTYLQRLDKKESLFKKHGFTHAREAYENYLKYFGEYEDEKISNCIIRHMFPLNIIPPKYKESWVVTYSDKAVSFKDTGAIFKALLFCRKNKKNHL